MPALTMVAACRYALTGVMATIAPGSQEWNGSCADLVNAASATRTATGTANPESEISSGWATIVSRSEVPVATMMRTTATSNPTPPPAVTSSARLAGAAECGPVPPMRKKDEIAVSSQNTNSSTRSAARTNPSMAPANSVSSMYVRTWWSPCRYRGQYAMIRAPTPTTSTANSADRPSRRSVTAIPSDGIHGTENSTGRLATASTTAGVSTTPSSRKPTART